MALSPQRCSAAPSRVPRMTSSTFCAGEAEQTCGHRDQDSKTHRCLHAHLNSGTWPHHPCVRVRLQCSTGRNCASERSGRVLSTWEPWDLESRESLTAAGFDGRRSARLSLRRSGKKSALEALRGPDPRWLCWPESQTLFRIGQPVGAANGHGAVANGMEKKSLGGPGQ